MTEGTDTLYFQYDANGTPLGFIYNGTQYLYMTNQMGDVISITDAQGNELVEYEYDEWGKLILTRADNQSNESIAKNWLLLSTKPLLRSKYLQIYKCRFTRVCSDAERRTYRK